MALENNQAVDFQLLTESKPQAINHELICFNFACRESNYAWFVAEKLSYAISFTRWISKLNTNHRKTDNDGENNCHSVSTFIIVYNHFKLG